MWRAALCVLLATAPAEAADAASLFRLHCTPCHGADGTGGRGPNLAIRTLPRAPDDAALSAIIATGIPGTQMPGTRMTAARSHR